MSTSYRIEESGVPLRDIADTLEDLVELYGGEIVGREPDEVRFSVPLRRGVAAAGSIDCQVGWRYDEGESGTVFLESEDAVRASRPARLGLLLVGVVGALLWILWPFFPNMGAVSWIGGAVAFATYFLTSRKTGGGVCADLLGRLAETQKDLARENVESAQGNDP